MCVNPAITHSKHWISKGYKFSDGRALILIDFSGYLTWLCVGYVGYFGILEDSAAY
jgi:hypothetical protein